MQEIKTNVITTFCNLWYWECMAIERILLANIIMLHAMMHKLIGHVLFLFALHVYCYYCHVRVLGKDDKSTLGYGYQLPGLTVATSTH